MARRTWLGEFPGGVLELDAYDDDDADGYPGVYLEMRGAVGEPPRGDDMRYRPTAIGYLRTDVSATARFHDESRIRELAARLGYDFADMIVYDQKFGRPPLARLKSQIGRLGARAVFVPGLVHFEGGQVPGSLTELVDVITVSPEATYERRAIPSSPKLPPRKVNGA
ncbi:MULTISPECIES: hypothetical protein [unclassified Nocardia]|uniref:hypothetical protein n=1 Tax=unclassified Nocardia TaxID=2637762 RepID=UPI0024A8330F|nr:MULTISPECIES: hypothetical protein [unclassified Nocardia]